MKNKLTKKEISWILYDWANSSFGIIIVTAVLPIYITNVGSKAGFSNADTAAFWSYANSFSSFAVALVAPILGILADFKGVKKYLFNLFTIGGILMTFSLSLIPDNKFWWIITFFMLANIGYSSANIFYDSFLTDITEEKRMDKISTLGYGFGYAGGLIPFILFYTMLQTGIIKGNIAYLIAFGIAGIWWLVWSLPIMLNVNAITKKKIPKHAISYSIKSAYKTIMHIAEYPKIAIFLLAYFFFIDGVNTIFTVASPFGLAVGLKSSQLLIVLLVVQIIAFPFSILYGIMANKVGTKKTLITGLLIYIFITIYSLLINDIMHFWILAILVGTSQGGVQALSRSYFGQIIPKERSAEFFGFFNILGKFSAIVGPFMFGVIAQMSGRVQYGAFSLIILFILGLYFLRKVDK
ncbi:MAG: MFS transporter [Lactobacillaceae bacterium]|jgi:UMF1 family MFS transporter|nr:MFS transporter [Lactobacillaceae bacterium]